MLACEGETAHETGGQHSNQNNEKVAGNNCDAVVYDSVSTRQMNVCKGWRCMLAQKPNATPEKWRLYSTANSTKTKEDIKLRG